MKNTWQNRAVALLDKCFAHVPTELNEMDWKIELSDKNERIAQHLCAFANYMNGGFLVFGISDQGQMLEVGRENADEIVNRIGGIARQTLNYPISIDHAIISYNNRNLLFVYVKERAACLDIRLESVHLRRIKKSRNYCAGDKPAVLAP